MTWQIANIEADDLITEGVPTFERGKEVALEFLIETGNVEQESFTEVLGTDAGTTLGGEAGGSLSTDTLSGPLANYQALLDYIEVDGTVAHGTTNTGNVYVREYLSDDAPVDTLIVPITRTEGASDFPSIWGAITGGTDTTRVHGFFAVELDVVILGAYDEFSSVLDVKKNLSTTLTQL